MPLPAGQSGAGVAIAALEVEAESVALLDVEAEMVDVPSFLEDETVDDFESTEACVEADPRVDVTAVVLPSPSTVVPLLVV